MKKYLMAAALMAVVCVSANAKKKEVKEVLFGIKSGVITVSSDMGDMPDFSAMGGMGGGGLAAFGDSTFLNMMNRFNSADMREQIYFDDYGRKTARVNVYGDEITRTISLGDSTYTINEKENTATVMPIFGGGRNGRGGMGGFGGGFSMGGAQIGQIGQIDWLNLDKKTIRRNKIKELGEEQVAGVTCKKYSMSPTNQMGFTQNITVCVYEGIPLSTVTESDWATTSQTAVGFLPNDEIPAEMFTLPKGCKVSEMSMGGFGGGMMMGGDFDFGGGGFPGGGGGFGGGFPGGGFGGF